MPRFFRLRMSAERAHAERWREGVLPEGQMLELERLYEQALEAPRGRRRQLRASPASHPGAFPRERRRRPGRPWPM